MPKAAKAPGGSTSSVQELPFEEALQKLESIVESMEADDLPLDTLLKRFEEGTKLAEHCKEQLTEAELKIRKLEKNADGGVVLEDLPVDEEEPNSSGD
jgi:exodeoxyribonuclease VII small subunit